MLSDDEKKLGDEIYSSLLQNHMTSAVADFLADLAIRIRRLELPTPPAATQEVKS